MSQIKSSSRRGISGKTYRKELIEKINNNIELTKRDAKYIEELLTESSLRRLQSSAQNASTQTDEAVDDDKGFSLVDDSEITDFLKRRAFEGPDGRTKSVSDDIKDCMDYLFKKRRHFIVHQAPTVPELSRCFPILFEKQQLIDELSRIIGVDGNTNYYKNLDELRLKVMKILRNVADPLRVSSLVKRELKKLSISNVANLKEKRQYIESCGALLYLPSLFKEDCTKMIHFDTSQITKPIPIVITSSPFEDFFKPNTLFQVFAENTKVYESKNFVEVFFFYVAIFFIFDMSFLQDCTQTFTFVETYLLGANPGLDIGSVKYIIRMLNDM